MTFKSICIVVSALLYVGSLFLPSFDCGVGHRPSFKGYEVFWSGWVGIIGLEPRWYANIFYFYVAGKNITNSKPKPFAVVFMFISAISAPLLPGLITCPDMDTMAPAKGLAIGGYLWTCAIFIMAIPYLPKIPSLPEWKDERR